MDTSGLPLECLVEVCRYLTATNLACVSSVCKGFRVAASTPTLWRHLALLRWKFWADQSFMHNLQHNWKSIYRERHTLDKRIIVVLHKICTITQNYSEYFKEVTSYGKNAVDVLKGVTQRAPQNTDLTMKYYASFLLQRIRTVMLNESWQQLLSQPEEEQRVEDGSIIICQAIYPDLTFDDIHSQLDALANELRPQLNQLSTFQQKLDFIMHFLFYEKGFKGNTENYYEQENSLLNHVLDRKLGLPISLSILLSAIARRVNFPIELVNFPSHFLAKTTDPETGRSYIIDAFYGKLILPTEILDSSTSANFQRARNRDIFLRQLSNLIHLEQSKKSDIVKFADHFVHLSQTNSQCRLIRARIRSNNRADVDLILEDCEYLANESRQYQRVFQFYKFAYERFNRPDLYLSCKTRREHPTVHFRVGQVVRMASSLAVVCGWTENVYHSYFVILPFDEQEHRKEEDQLQAVDSDEITLTLMDTFPCAGKYFDRFEQRVGFIVNEKLRYEYPDD